MEKHMKMELEHNATKMAHSLKLMQRIIHTMTQKILQLNMGNWKMNWKDGHLAKFNIEQEKSIEFIFNLYDHDDSGELTSEEFYILGKALNNVIGDHNENSWDEDRSNTLFAQLDRNASGGINHEEFIHFFHAMITDPEARSQAVSECLMEWVNDTGANIKVNIRPCALFVLFIP